MAVVLATMCSFSIVYKALCLCKLEAFVPLSVPLQNSAHNYSGSRSDRGIPGPLGRMVCMEHGLMRKCL